MPTPTRTHIGTVLFLAFLGVAGSLQVFPNGFVVALVTLAIFIRFIVEMDEGIPIEVISALISVVQWLTGPAMHFAMAIESDRYAMYVEAGEYFAFAIPATCAFVCGVLLWPGSGNEVNLLRKRDGSSDFSVGMVLVLVSVASDFVGPRAPSGLSFFFHIASQLRYIGAIYFLFSGHRYRWLMAAAALSKLFISSAESAMFHDLLLWLGLLGCYWWLLRRRSLGEKIVFVAFAVILTGSIQVIKRDYRDAVWSGRNPSLFEIAYDVIVERMAFSEKATIETAVIRMNQGWIISAVMRHVPAREPFAGGETIVDALEAAVLPRFLAPNKKKAGGQENFRRFTGLPLADSTSMGISPLGEAYANYGVGGGTFFMLVWGGVFGLVIGMFRRFGMRDPTILFWTPLIFYQTIKAETEIVVVLNQLTKGSVVAFACYYFIHHLWLKNAGFRSEGTPEYVPVKPHASLVDIQRH
jgi:hypothetical protein